MCTRVFWNDNGKALVVGRTMDWPESTEPIWTIFPRGAKRNGGMLAGHSLGLENPLKWTAKYGSLIVSVYGLGTVDGLNEKGLAAHMLFLPETDFGPVDSSKPAVHAGLWAQYLLDRASTVGEALALQDDIQLVMVEARGRQATVHLALEDANGDSAIVEYVDGKQTVHQGSEYQVMTNSPAYDEQLALLAQQDFSKPSSDMPLPGNVNPRDRFQRATYFLSMLPEPASEREAIASVLSVVRNTSVPFGAPYKDVGIYNTEYRTVLDLSNKRSFFELSTSPNVLWADLNQIDFTKGSGVRTLDPDNLDLSGNITDRFTPAEVAF
ncbi:MAG: linear amide C-N hydrolase [Thermomicrobiales bacterium]|nr:linear amide C-N hydrolase [Thermomicrobiales bacterium]